MVAVQVGRGNKENQEKMNAEKHTAVQKSASVGSQPWTEGTQLKSSMSWGSRRLKSRAGLVTVIIRNPCTIG